MYLMLVTSCGSISRHTPGMSGRGICCPLTTQVKHYPFEVLVGDAAGSAVLADQTKNLDWRCRKATRKGRAQRFKHSSADCGASARPAVAAV